MFKKPFKIKSNSQIKSSERKVLREVFIKNFPTLTENDIDSLLPKKETVFCMKIFTSDNNVVLVYLIQKRAIAFEYEGVLYPTVYMLWKYYNLLITFTTNNFVVAKITTGADLMLPGVIINPNGYVQFREKERACINSMSNKCPIAVGVTGMSCYDMASAKSRGKSVIVYHYIGDKLCSLEDLPVLPVPEMGPPNWLKYRLENGNDFPALGEKPKEVSPSNDKNAPNVLKEITKGEDSNIQEETNTSESVNDVEDMDQLLIRCFLTAIKYSKTLELPMLTSSFYKLEVMPLCPPDKFLDIKKSTFKKVGQFLKHMTKEGIIAVKEKKKGIETLESINHQHPQVMNFYVEVENRPKKPTSENEETNSAPSIVESYVITNAVIPIFQEFGFKKGDTLQPSDVRKHVTMYVKNHNCQNEENKRFVNVKDSALAALCKNENSVTWEELIEKIYNAMKSCFKVSSGGEETFTKGKIQPIIMTVNSRAGNKKVTLVDNIELFGIRMSEFAKECQHGVAASTSVSRPPGKKTDQLLIQGNQILFIYNLLTDKYKIPKRYIRGLEYAPKTKK